MSLIEAQPLPKPPSKALEKALRVTGKWKAAIDAMVWLGHTRAEAAEVAGINEKSLYNAFCKPHVKAYYLMQLDVLRTSERARNIHALVEVRNQRSNQMARVNAVQALERLEDQSHSAGTQRQSPGLTIIIEGERHSRDVRVIDDKPLISLDPVCNGDDEGQR